MKPWIGLAVAVMLLSPLSGWAQTPADREAIVATIDRWDSAWRSKDAGLGARDYADDADWVNAFGMRRRGRSEIEATLKEVFSLPFVAAGVSTTKDHDVRFLGPSAAVVLTSVERTGQTAPSGEALGVRHTTHLRALEKRDGRWVIVSHVISDARDRDRPAH